MRLCIQVQIRNRDRIRFLRQQSRPADRVPDLDQYSIGVPTYMTTTTPESVQPKQVAVNDIGTAEDFLAAVDEKIGRASCRERV